MTKDMLRTVVRRTFAIAVLAPAVLLATAAPALAAAPDAWEDPDNPSTLHVLLLLVGAPLALFVAITLAVGLPAMIRSSKADPALAFRDRPEWFGGPRQGVDKAPAEPTGGDDKGGGSGHW